MLAVPRVPACAATRSSSPPSTSPLPICEPRLQLKTESQCPCGRRYCCIRVWWKQGGRGYTNSGVLLLVLLWGLLVLFAGRERGEERGEQAWYSICKKAGRREEEVSIAVSGLVGLGLTPEQGQSRGRVGGATRGRRRRRAGIAGIESLNGASCKRGIWFTQ